MYNNIWEKLVVKHTVNGSCNFQLAADELAELVKEKTKKDIEYQITTISYTLAKEGYIEFAERLLFTVKLVLENE